MKTICLPLIYQKRKKMYNQEEVVNQFIIDTVLIDPIKDILKKLKENEFRDCDIKWLDRNLEKFFLFAAETLDIKGILSAQSLKSDFNIMNDYVKDYYISKFTVILNYFKNL